MKLGFICPNAAGHLNPITALARQLQARNHDVVFLYSSGAAGLPFVPGPDKDGPVPKNAIMVKRAPQLELLKQTSVCITHAGLNTVLESLTQGVPQVAIPAGLDQPGVAARIADKKTGVVTSLDKLTTEHLSTLLNEVLNNSTYRDNAGNVENAIAEANGLSVAADLIEESLGVTATAAKM